MTEMELNAERVRKVYPGALAWLDRFGWIIYREVYAMEPVDDAGYRPSISSAWAAAAKAVEGNR